MRELKPLPSNAFLLERDMDKSPVLETHHLGIAFGGPEAVTPANIRAVYGMDAAVEQVRGVPVVIPAL